MNSTQQTKTLNQLTIGQSAQVTALSSIGADRRRMLDLGILPGTTITVEMSSPMGDPVAYRIRGSLIALRNSQAEQISIVPLEATS